MRTIFELCDLVRETAFSIHVFHGHGHLEKVYENALGHRLRKLGLKGAQQHPITVCDKTAPSSASIWRICSSKTF